MKVKILLLASCTLILFWSITLPQSVEWAQHFNLGVQKVKAGLYQEATKEFKTCIELDRTQTEAFKNLAYCAIKLEDYEGAIKAYQDFLNVSPNDVDVMKALASLLLKTKRYSTAYDILKKITLFAPEESESLVNLGLVCDYLGRNDEALENYLKALKMRPGDKNLAFNIGRLYFLKAEYETSISYFKAVLDRSPQDYDASLNIANAYMSLGEREYKRIKNLKDQGYADESTIIEGNLKVRGYYERALPYLLVTAKVRKPTCIVLNNLGITLKNLGRANESTRVLEMASAIKRSQPIDIAYIESIPLESTVPLYVQKTGPASIAATGNPPLLTSEVTFNEPSKNNALDAEETGTITVKVKNIGKGPAAFVHIELEPEKQYPHLIFDRQRQLPAIAADDSVEINIPISADMDVPNTIVKLKVQVLEEQFGNDADPFNLSFECRALRPPKLVLAEYGIDDDDDGESMGNDNGRIEKGETIELMAIVSNRGIGLAEDVVLHINPPGEDYFFYQSDRNFELGDIAPGASKRIKLAFSTGKRYGKNKIDFGLAIMERRSRFNVTDNISLTLKERQTLARNLVVEGIEEAIHEVPAERYEPTLTVDVDMDIPQAGQVNENAVAVIIGNKNYQHRDVFRVDYAHRDAHIMRDYVERMFGYLPGNIIFQLDASQGDFISIFGNPTDYKGKLYNYIKAGESDVFVYYSGHGAPDPETQKSFFLPVDCDPALVRLNGYSLEVLYNNLSLMPAKSITVVVDACFSGLSDQGMLLKGISPVYIEAENPAMARDNMFVFTSSSGKQVSTWYPDKKHSLFTYFFLKGLRGDADQDQNNEITAKELLDFTTDKVSYMARRLKSREQSPMFFGINDDVVIKRY